MTRRVRTAPFTERVPAWEVGRPALGLLAALAAGYAGLFVLALVASPSGFLLAACVLVAVELALFAASPFCVWMLARVGAGGPTRSLVRGVLALALLLRVGAPQSWVLLTAGALLAGQAVRAAGSALAEISRIQRKMPIVARGLALGRLGVPPAPPVPLARRPAETLSLPDLLLAPAAAATVLTGSVVPLAVGAVVALGLVLGCSLVLLRAVLAMRRVPRRRFVAAVSRTLDEASPEVALYLGSGPDTLYQLEMWVETLERLERPAVIILRDRESMAQLGPTRLPVVCVESGSVLMSLPMPSLRLALYVAHASTNLHLLRRPGVTHAFIGHGDSDKSASVNPFLKAYDEIWVSGPAAHSRFAAAGLGDAVRRIVEIGRPQLDGVARSEREPRPRHGAAAPLTVLYAPTWEGYGDESDETSLGACGLSLVRLLLAAGARVLYRPHPLVGTRDPAAEQAHRQVLALLGNPVSTRAPLRPGDRSISSDNLDLAENVSAASRVESVAAQDEWARGEMADVRGRHLLVPGPDVSLRVCFAAADVLLADVSSVVSDFVATGKPYGVTNPANLPAEEFAARYPTSGGGYLVHSDGRGLAELLAAGRGEEDPLRGQRRALRDRLLGPPQPPALVRMRRQVDRVVTGQEPRPAADLRTVAVGSATGVGAPALTPAPGVEDT